MTTSRILSLPVLLSFLLYGCLQPLHKTSVSQNGDVLPKQTSDIDVVGSLQKANHRDQKSLRPDKNCLPAQAITPDLIEQPQKVDHKDPKPSQLDHPATNNNIEDSAVKSNYKNESHIAENSLPEKKIQSSLDEALDFCQASQDFWQKGELDNAIEALDHAYSLILKIDTNDTPKLIQQKEDLRFMISKRILEIYASRNIVVNGNHNAIPMVMNKHIQDEINLFTKKGEKKFFIQSYKRSGRYRSQIV